MTDAAISSPDAQAARAAELEDLRNRNLAKQGSEQLSEYSICYRTLRDGPFASPHPAVLASIWTYRHD